MNESLIYQTDTWLIVTILFVQMVLFAYLGWRMGLTDEEESGLETGGTVIGALLGLLGLLIAITFGMVGNRFDIRQNKIVEEAASIQTAFLQTDLYPVIEQAPFRADFRNYIENRIAYLESGRSKAKLDTALQHGNIFYGRLWQRAVRLSRDSANQIATDRMIPALNGMLEKGTTLQMAEKMRVPDSVVVMLFLLSLATAFYSGYISVARGTLDWLLLVGFSLLVCLTIFITLDLDRPRRGLFRVRMAEQAIIDLRKLTETAREP